MDASIAITTLDHRLLDLSDEELSVLKAALLKAREAEELTEAEQE